jgi:hypothetical protein
MPKNVIISIQYANNLKFFLAIGDIGYSDKAKMPGEDYGKAGKMTGFFDIGISDRSDRVIRD